MQVENLINDAVEMYVTVINPYGENNAPFDSEAEYIESLKQDFKERKYVLEYMNQGSDVPAFVDLCQMILDRLPIEEHIAIDRYDQLGDDGLEVVKEDVTTPSNKEPLRSTEKLSEWFNKEGEFWPKPEEVNGRTGLSTTNVKYKTADNRSMFVSREGEKYLARIFKKDRLATDRETVEHSEVFDRWDDFIEYAKANGWTPVIKPYTSKQQEAKLREVIRKLKSVSDSYKEAVAAGDLDSAKTYKRVYNMWIDANNDLDLTGYTDLIPQEDLDESVVVFNEEFSMEKYKAAQKKAYELLKKTDCFAVIYAYTTGKERIIFDKPLEKRSQQEVWDFVKSFKTGKQADRVVVDVLYKSKMDLYDNYFNNDVNERLVVEEYKVEKDWNQGSQTVLSRDSDEYKKLEYVADRLQRTSANDWTYYPADTYLDFGQGWQWTTILCKDNKQHQHQVLDSSEWFDIMNAKTNAELDAVVRTIKSGEWFQDRVRLESIVDAMRYED